MNAPEQVVDRRAFLGGSDAAAVLKVSPWATPLDVFLEKTGQSVKVVDADREKLFRRGKLLEPVALTMAIEDYGIKVTKRSTPAKPNRYIDQEHGFLAVEIDFEWEVTQDDIDRWHLSPALLGTVQNGEVKTVHHFASAKFGNAGTEDVPIEYAAQAMDGLMITGRKVCLFVVLVGADELAIYFVYRDDATIAVMRRALVNFWQNNVLAGVEPDPIRLPDITKLFKRREAINVEASEGAMAVLLAFRDAKEQQRIAEETVENAKFELGKFMLGEDAIVRPVGARGGKKPVEPTQFAQKITHTLTFNGRPELEINLQEQNRLDNDKVREQYPEVAAECQYQIRFFRYDPPKKRK